MMGSVQIVFGFGGENGCLKDLDVSGSGRRRSHEHAAAALAFSLLLGSARILTISGLGLLFGFESSDLLHQLEVGFIDVRSALGRCLEEGAVIDLRHLLTFLSADGTLGLQVALVSNDDDGVVVNVLHVQDSLAILVEFFKALAIVDGVDDEEALSCPNLCRVELRVRYHIKRVSIQLVLQ